MKVIGKYKIYADDLLVAHLLGKERVCKASDLAIPYMGSYKSRHAKRLDGETPFSTQVEASDVRENTDKYPRFVGDYIRRNPRVRLLVYSTNTRLLNRILNNE